MAINKNSTDIKLKKAIRLMADVIVKESELLKNAEKRDLRKLKELATAAKELSSITKALDKDDESENRCGGITVIFEGEETQKWAT